VPHLSVVIPAYNEEERLGSTLSSITDYLEVQRYDSEIIVVDDGSTDKTVAVAERFEGVRVLRNPQNMGKGATVAHGILAAQGDFVLFTDADGSTPIGEVAKVLSAHSEGYDVVIGSRALPHSHIVHYQPLHRVLLGKAFNLAVQLLALPGLKDTQCGFKSFTREAATEVFTRRTIDHWGFDMEILYIARRFGFRVKEVGIEWEDSPASKVNALRDGFKMLGDLVRIRYQDMRGVYQ